MKILSRALSLVLVASLSAAAPPDEPSPQERPSLIVALVVDQLRPDLLERYESAFAGGFVRLGEQGYRFTQASHGHARTSTAPGHATISTGVFPSRHGVVANSWAQRTAFDWRSTYAVADPESPILGFEQVEVLEGRSPKTLLREGLPDWLLARDEDARVVSVSKKDRAAIPMGGQGTEHVFWILPELGRFITSRYYMDGYPGWVRRFNEDVMPGISADTVWSSEVPPELRGLARPDAAAYEGDEVHTTFPHVSSAENADPNVQQHNVWGYDQPRADRAVLEFARTAIDELDLGQRSEQDHLAISLSATDRVGHAYGPLSQEQLSNLVHLDRLLGEFFDHLDDVVGEGRWLLGFTADHGVVTTPEAQVELGINPGARRIMLDEVQVEMGQALRDAAAGGGAAEEVAERLARLVVERGLVAGAYTHHELTLGMPSDSFAVLFRNSHYPGRAWGPLSRWGVEVRFGDGDLASTFASGTNHESTYWYDRHVPMIFMGPGVQPGSSDRPVYTVDFAPTLAGLAGIPVPPDLDGRRIY